MWGEDGNGVRLIEFYGRYETGGMRRTHLRGHENILKRQLIHVGAFNLSLAMRKLLGAGTPRELRNRFGARMLRVILRLARQKRPNRLPRGRISALAAKCFARSRSRLRHFPCEKLATKPRAANVIQ
jgi:hypothetical protein